MRTLLLILCVVATPFQMGCSAFMNRVGDNRPVGHRPACDDGVILPVLDMIPAAYFGLLALAIASDDPGGALGSGLVATAFGTSGVVGFRGGSKCKSEEREWEKELRFGYLTGEIRARTKMEPVQDPDRPDTLILKARNSDTCALLDWTHEIDMMRAQLEARDVHRVECRFDELTLWGGPLSGLPETLEDTICADPLLAYFRSSNSRELEQRRRTLPAMCRHGAKVMDWYMEAAKLASQGQCAEALILGEKIWHTTPSVHKQLLRNPEVVACFDTQSTQAVSP